MLVGLHIAENMMSMFDNYCLLVEANRRTNS